MSEENPSLFFYGPGRVKYGNRPIKESGLSPTDVVIRIAYVGVCGSDVHFWTAGGMQRKVSAENPIVLGHEASGVVHSVGCRVKNVKVGDRVTTEPGFPCRTCRHCKTGRYNLCNDMRFAASPAEDGVEILHGCLAKYFVIPSDFCFKLPDHIDLQTGVMVEPLAVACKAVRHVGVKPEDKVVIFGAGTVGSLCAAVALELDPKKVICVDVNDRKLHFLVSWLGNRRVETFVPPKSAAPQEVAQAIIDLFDLGVGADVVIEATGASPCIQAGIHVLDRGGSYIQTGLGVETLEFPIMAVSEKELNIKGHFRYMTRDFEMAIGLLERKKIDVKPLISRVFPFEQATEAWEATRKGEGIKNVIEGVRD